MTTMFTALGEQAEAIRQAKLSHLLINMKTAKTNKKKVEPVLPIKKISTIGKWVEKPTRMEILVCSCGNKYIKTRKGQTVCVQCINKTL